MGMTTTIHQSCVASRRVRVLNEHLARLAPKNASILDVGAGDGELALELHAARPDLEISCVDVHVREGTHVSVDSFDGLTLPYADGSFDGIMLIDVLHHADNPFALLCEASRVSRSCILIKDHLRDGLLAGPTLRFMDRVGNERHGVSLPYNYWKRTQWTEAFETLGLRTEEWIGKLGLYPKPADWIFGRGLHFMARLTKTAR